MVARPSPLDDNAEIDEGDDPSELLRPLLEWPDLFGFPTCASSVQSVGSSDDDVPSELLGGGGSGQAGAGGPSDGALMAVGGQPTDEGDDPSELLGMGVNSSTFQLNLSRLCQ